MAVRMPGVLRELTFLKADDTIKYKYIILEIVNIEFFGLNILIYGKKSFTSFTSKRPHTRQVRAELLCLYGEINARS